ncbi:inositol monophosphatase family protein [uncultured Imperialibacter sp.]|uniref:inositol monophosphatase family protein n=1 Tax=uncultured Imperialibacter sp. TaxID=1672639 RepID=UPI0030DC50D5|tara:strand:+ start:545 stop:1342 length:798 start_codon:yes stop_codon:yes gene_type:complete
MEIPLETLVHHVIAISKEAGQFLKNEAEGFTPDMIELKGHNNLVSYVDKACEEMIVERLREVLPEAGFITEEGTVASSEQSLQWVIDPLDGTTNFVHGLPIYSVSLALVRDKQAILGVVYEVNRDECFHAIKGKGAFCNGKPIRVSSATQINESLLATGFPYNDFGKMMPYLNILNELMKSSHGLRRMGSAAVDLAYVACGRFEAFFEFNLNSWDVAAGVLLVTEAGGTVTDFKGGDNYIFGRELIAGCGIQSELLGTIKKFWLD